MPAPLHRTLVAALLICLAPLAWSQSDPDPDLEKLKEEFLSDLRQEIEPASRLYLVELRKLERKFALAGDFQAAIAARDERLALEEFLGTKQTATTPDPKPDPKPAPVGVRSSSGDDSDLYASLAKDLMIPAATASEGASLDGGKLDLSAPSAAASWMRGSIEPGGYEFIVHYTASTDTKVRVAEGFYRMTTDLPATKGRKPVSISLGTLIIKEESDSITFTNLGVVEGASLVIHSIQMISAKEWHELRRSSK